MPEMQHLKLLKVLMVEDSEVDAMLILRHLKKGGYEPVWQCIDTAEALREQLQNQTWEVILADYNMPGFSGLAALSILKELNLDIPFILVSGAVGEETAVEAMKAGANDYVLKDKLTRLIPAIERELNEAKSRAMRRLAEEARSRLERELQQSKELAELSNQRKSRVLAFVAHEFKNPLKAIETFADILQKGPLNDNQQMMVEGIATACQHIRELMDDILDIAPIEAGQIELNLQVIELSTLLDEVKIILEEPAKIREITLDFACESSIQLLRVDPKRLRQILINLLSNAIKYTHTNDTVQLRIQPNEHGLQITVTDNGPGIPENELDSLFLDYYRVKNTLSKQKEGLGLGLALVKKLVELHEGAISVESKLGEGTGFIVQFPPQVIVNAICCSEPNLEPQTALLG